MEDVGRDGPYFLVFLCSRLLRHFSEFVAALLMLRNFWKVFSPRDWNVFTYFYIKQCRVETCQYFILQTLLNIFIISIFVTKLSYYGNFSSFSSFFDVFLGLLMVPLFRIIYYLKVKPQSFFGTTQVGALSKRLLKNSWFWIFVWQTSFCFSFDVENGMSHRHGVESQRSPSMVLSSTVMPHSQRRESFLYRSDQEGEQSPSNATRNSSLVGDP